MNTFKQRWTGHKSDVRCGRARTGITSFLIDLNKKGITPEAVEWSKVMSSHPRSKGSKYCPLCLDEKVTILRTQDAESLNDRSELMTRCRHADSFMLENCYKSKRRKKNHTPSQNASVDSVPVVAQQSEVEQQDEPSGIASDARDNQPEREEDPAASGRPRRKDRINYSSFF